MRCRAAIQRAAENRNVKKTMAARPPIEAVLADEVAKKEDAACVVE